MVPFNLNHLTHNIISNQPEASTKQPLLYIDIRYWPLNGIILYGTGIIYCFLFGYHIIFNNRYWNMNPKIYYKLLKFTRLMFSSKICYHQTIIRRGRRMRKLPKPSMFIRIRHIVNKGHLRKLQQCGKSQPEFYDLWCKNCPVYHKWHNRLGLICISHVYCWTE